MPIVLLQLALELPPPLFVVHSISVSSHDSKVNCSFIILKSEYRIVFYVVCWNLPSSWRMSSQCLWVLTCEYSAMAAAHPRPQMVQFWDCEVTSTPTFLLSLFSCRSEMRSRSKLYLHVAQERLHSKQFWAVVSQVAGSILRSWRLFFNESFYRFTGRPQTMLPEDSWL